MGWFDVGVGRGVRDSEVVGEGRADIAGRSDGMP